MMMMSGFVERVINSPQRLRRAVDQRNRSALSCRVNVGGERVAVRIAAGKLFQMTVEWETLKMTKPENGREALEALCRCFN